MKKVLPFKGWRYNPEKVDISKVVSPPYDVVSQEELTFYKSLSPYNIFHLELPESPEIAKNKLTEWIENRILQKDQQDMFYVYELEFHHEGKKFERKGLVGALKLFPFEDGVVLPHEKVFPKVTQERFALLKETCFQFSQIFCLYSGKDKNLWEEIDKKKKPLYQVSFNGELHRFYALCDEALLKKISQFFEDKVFYIADGHHRYTTALKFKEFMKNLANKKNENEEQEFERIAVYFCNLDDPNLLILPTHRVYFFPFEQGTLKKFLNFYKILKTSEPHLEKIKELSQNFFNPSSQILLVTKEKTYFMEIKSEVYENLKKENPILSEMSLFNYLKIFEEVFEVSEEELKKEKKIKFLSEIEKIFANLDDSGFAVIFPSLSSEIFKKISENGLRMPHKSTFFYPKILTGFVLKRTCPET